MTDPVEGFNSGVDKVVVGTITSSGDFNAGGNVSGFTPSSYDVDLTMNGTAQAVALASGAERIHVVNRGATTEAIRVAFGTSASNAQGNLSMTTDGAPEHATTGYYIPAIADGIGEAVLGTPALATHYAVANAVDSDTQVVSITQGV